MYAPYRKRVRYPQPAHVAMSWDVLNGKAYRDLTPSAAKALPYFLGKVKKTYPDPERYEKIFNFSYDEAHRYGFAYSTFHNIVQEMVRKGFVDPIAKGGLKSDGKGYSKFRLSRRWEEYGKEGFVAIEWSCFLPKPRVKATSKKEKHSIEN